MSNLKLAIKTRNFEECKKYYLDKHQTQKSIDEKLFNTILSIFLAHFDKMDLILKNIVQDRITKKEFTLTASYSLSIDFLCKNNHIDEALYQLLKFLKNNSLKHRHISPFFKKIGEDKRLDIAIGIFKLVDKNNIKILEDEIFVLGRLFKGNKELMLKLKTYIHKYYLKFGIILLEFFNIIHDLEEVTINKSCCSKCNEVLCVDSLNRDDILTFLSNIDIKYNMQKFKQWIKKNNSYNVIIDGANVGYYNQRPDLGGTLNVSQIDKIYEYYNSLQKNVLIFLHRKHIVTLEKNDSIYKKWKKTKSIYFTPFKSNDDIYWLYYFLHSKIDTKCSLLITNDNMSDHIFQLLDREQFSRLKNSTILNYDFVNSDLVITSSIEYSEVYQENGDHVHIPFVTNDKILWFCGNKI